MSSQTNGPETGADWEVTPAGLYIATRHFLVRRGYCCANRCRNCPYINWRADPDWEPAPADAIQLTRVSPKALAAARLALAEHQQALNHSTTASEQTHHSAMIAHYQRLLERWW